MRATMEEPVACVGDAIIYGSDLQLLDHGNWLNDRVIAFYAELLQRQSRFEKCLFMDPSMVQLLKLLEGVNGFVYVHYM